MKKYPFLSKLTVFLGLIFGALSMNHAAVSYTDWSNQDVNTIINKAQANEQMIMVVVTQPDWCPPCIKMENAIIKNSEETEFSNLAKGWVNLEVLGYDAPGAKFLEEQGLRFHGTPTTILLDPSKISNNLKAKQAKLKAPKLTLGDLRVVHSLAGFPDDFTEQFKKAAGGYDMLAEAQAAMRAEQSVESYANLAEAYIYQGDIARANRVYASLFMRSDLSQEQRQELEWKQISDVTQRVAKNHALTVKQINAFVERHPEFLSDKDNNEDYAYKKAWSLVAIGQVDEAKELMRKVYVEPQDVANIRTYLYFAFRNPLPELVEDAYAVNQQALKDFPDAEASLQASRGRLLRRLERYEDAKAAFERAIELLPEDSESLATYQGQLDYVLTEIDSRQESIAADKTKT